MGQGLDSDKDSNLSFQEFQAILEKKEVWKLLQQVDVNPMNFIDFGELYFFDDDVEIKLTFKEFMDMIMDLRENNQATVKTMLNMWMKVKSKLCMNYHSINELKDNVRGGSREMGAKMAKIESLTGDILGE